MNTKTRIQKLESAKPESVEADNRHFMQEVRTEGNKFYIDGVQVDEATYTKELAEYMRLRKKKNIPAEIVVNLMDGVQ